MFYGLSGVTHGMAGLSAVFCVNRGIGRGDILSSIGGGFFGILLLHKIFYEFLTGTFLFESAEFCPFAADLPIAHAIGFAAGLSPLWVKSLDSFRSD